MKLYTDAGNTGGLKILIASKERASAVDIKLVKHDGEHHVSIFSIIAQVFFQLSSCV